jgi:hypothetical protein
MAQRSARRATARRASSRRATARLHKPDIEERVSEYLNDHPLCTTSDLAKGLNVDRGKVAAARSHIANAGETANDQMLVEGRPPSAVDVPADDIAG